MRVGGAWRSSEFISSTGSLRPTDSRCTDYKGQAGLSSMGGAPSFPWQLQKGGGGHNKKALERAQEAVAGIPWHLRRELMGFARFQGPLGQKAAAELPHPRPGPSARCPGLFGDDIFIPGLRFSFC